MTPSDLRFVIGCVLAVVVPAAALHFTAADERLAAGLTAAPFAWPRVLIAHLASAIPLALMAAYRLRTVPAVNDAARALWVVVALGMTGLAALVCPGIGDAVSSGEFGAVPLLLLRAALALGLVFPWCVWATDPGAPGAKPHAAPGLPFALCAGFALLPCGLYAEAGVAGRTEQASDLLRRERLVRADAVLTGLVELGSDRPFGKQSPAEVRRGLATVLPSLKQAGERPLLSSAKPTDRQNRALLMIQLDRLGEAAELLEPLAATDDTAALLLATVYRDQEKWAASDELYARALEAKAPRAATDPAVRRACLTALEGLAFNAGADRRPADAERALKRGLDLLPDRAGDFHFRLGSHYHHGGRPGLALEHLREAVRLDPAAQGEPAARLIRQIQSSTPACVTWRAP